AFSQLEALDDMKLGRVRRAIIIDVGVVRKADRVDDQCIAAFVVPDGLTVRAYLRMRRMRNVEKDAAHFRSAFVDQENLILPLHEEKRVDSTHDEKSGDPSGATACASLIAALACRGKLVLLAHLLDDPWLEYRVCEIGDPKRHLSALVVVGHVRVVLCISDRARARRRRLEIICNL